MSSERSPALARICAAASEHFSAVGNEGLAQRDRPHGRHSRAVALFACDRQGRALPDGP